MNGQLYIYFNDDHTAPKCNTFSLVNQFNGERWVQRMEPLHTIRLPEIIAFMKSATELLSNVNFYSRFSLSFGRI